METMLTENHVVDAVQNSLTQQGWTIHSFATTVQQGVDIVAGRGQAVLYVEAKGETSSKETTSRFGKIHNSSQMYISVAAALLKVAELRHAYPGAAVAIALPRNATLRKRIDGIASVLHASNVAVFWVAPDSSVTAWNAPWFNGTP